MEEILKFFPVKNERTSAVDGKKMSLDEILLKFTLKSTNLSSYELACTLSHLNTIKKFSESNYNYALILEDDTTLELVKYWDKKISDIIKEAPDDWEIILLNYISWSTVNNTYELVKNYNISSTQAYIIKNSTAKNIIKKYYIDNKFNIGEFKKHSADCLLFDMCKSYCYKYPYFTYSNMNFSTIHIYHYFYHMISKKKILSSWENKNTETFSLFNNSYIIVILLIILICLFFI